MLMPRPVGLGVTPLITELVAVAFALATTALWWRPLGEEVGMDRAFEGVKGLDWVGDCSGSDLRIF